MADNEAEPEDKSEEGAEGEGSQKKSKAPIKLLGALVAIVGLGASLAIMAIPSGPEATPRFQGPFFHQLFSKQVVSNTRDNDFKRFIKTNPQVEFFAYDETYLAGRVEESLYKAWLDDAFNTLVAGKELDEIYNGSNRERFAQEIRHAIEPALFPIHLGGGPGPLQADPESGIRPGDSYRQNTFSGAFFEHLLKIDGKEKTLQIDDGPTTSFEGKELDLKVTAPSGEFVYLDVSALDPEFVGEVNIGVHGRVRQVFINEYLAQ